MRRSRFRYTPLVEIFISRERVLHNLHRLQEAVQPASVVPVLKSNAYGHGLIPIAQILDTQQLPFLVVDSYYEALILRNEGIRTPLLVIGYTDPQNISRSRLHDIIYTVTSIESMRQLAQQTRRQVRIHLKIDTGMHRQGIAPEESDAALTILRASPHIFLEGICSHLADADMPDSTFTDKQIAQWNPLVEQFQRAVPTLKYIHLSATAGIPYTQNIRANCVRTGLGLYGIPPSTVFHADVLPVLRMQTSITSIKTIHPGDRVGYNGTYTAQDRRCIATIPVGYYEGLDRRLSNTGVVTINGITCPIIGRVSMNMTTIDVTDLPDPHIGMPVIVVSDRSEDPNSIESCSAYAQTIPYELLVHLLGTIRRTVV